MSALAALLLLNQPIFAPEKILLRRDLSEGLTHVYEAEANSKQVIEAPGGLGEQEITVNQKMRQTMRILTGDPSGARAQVGVKILKMEVNAGGMPTPEMGDMPEIFSTWRINQLNRIQVSGTREMASFASIGTDLQAFAFPPFPAYPVRPGDSWTYAQVMGSKPTENAKNTVIEFLAAENAPDGKPIWRFRVRGKTVTDVSEATNSPEMGNMRMKTLVTSDTTANIIVDARTGATIESESKSELELKIEVNTGISIEGKGTATSKLRLIETKRS